MTYLEAIFFAEKIKETGVISESFKLLEDGTVVEHTITKLPEEGIKMLEFAIKAMKKVMEYEETVKHALDVAGEMFGKD